MSEPKFDALKFYRMAKTDVSAVSEILLENKLESWSEQDLQSEINFPNSLSLVCKYQSRVVAFCIARLIIKNSSITNISTKLKADCLEYEYECEIYNFAVKKEYQKKGIGKLLLDEMFLLVKSRNASAIWLEVRISNEKAFNFYQKNDFKKICERKNFYSNPAENAIVMKKELR